MTDLIGPASALNSTVLRPADTRVFGSNDTWFQPCSGPNVNDGTQVQAVYLNGILAQIRRAIRGMGIAENNADDDMLLKALQKVVTGYATEAQLLAGMPVHFLAVTNGNVVTTTPGSGQIVVDPGQTFIRRGFKPYSTDNYTLGQRTLATSPNKTYHLRWDVVNGFRLRDVADLGYNPSALPEADAALDGTYDDMLIARVVTNGANVLTVTGLVNKPGLFTTATKASFQRQAGSWVGLPSLYGTLNWSRRPVVSVPAFSVDATTGNESTVSVQTTRSRYGYLVFVAGYADTGPNFYVSGTCTAEVTA